LRSGEQSGTQGCGRGALSETVRSQGNVTSTSLTPFDCRFLWQKAVLDLLYELLGLPQPEWTDELSVALGAVDPSEPQSSWRLNEGFVAAEGRFILPHLAKTTPSITDMHLALLLYCFLECGLLGAIVEVIATSDTFISVRATVLLGELMHLIQILLPPECCNVSPALPSLLEYATHGKPQAIKAVNGLQQLQKLLKARPASYSLHLDFILRSGGNIKFSSKNSKKSRHKLKTLKFKWQQVSRQRARTFALRFIELVHFLYLFFDKIQIKPCLTSQI
jgi:hypothetical protein